MTDRFVSEDKYKSERKSKILAKEQEDKFMIRFNKNMERRSMFVNITAVAQASKLPQIKVLYLLSNIFDYINT
jgi:hypothetical protein